MVKVAVIGFGVVGSGVVEILSENKEVLNHSSGDDIEITKILDIREFPDSPYIHLVTKNADEIFEDPEISIVVETMGGTGFAYDYTKRALSKGKHVVTSNKEMVAKHGPELLKLAEENGVRYLFEASVGGGIPIIRPMTLCLGANRINEVMGILNGTTNYILTKMRDTGMSFDDALKRAQEKGYAEANPAADVEGHDTCRKIAILSSLAYNKYVDYNDLYCKGITDISTEDIKFASEMNMVIKLIGYSRYDDEGFFACVSPVLLPNEHSLAYVNGVFNAIMVKGDYIGETMFYGKGAGKNATASAVVGDIIDIVKNPKSKATTNWSEKVDNVLPFKDFSSSFFVRYSTEGSLKDAKDCLNKIFDKLSHVVVDEYSEKGIYGFVTEKMKVGDFREKIKELNNSFGNHGISILSSIILI